MLKLDWVHAGLQEHLTRLLSSSHNLSDIEFKVEGFDQVVHFIQGTDADSLRVVTTLPQLQSVGNAGGFDALSEDFANFQLELSNDSYSLGVSRANLPPIDAPEREEAIRSVTSEISRCHSVFMSGPFRRGFHLSKSSGSGGLEVDFRQGERLWVVPGNDRVTFIFQIEIENPIDQPLGKVILQEFMEAKRQVKNAPLTMFSPTPPENILGFPHGKCTASVGFLSVTVLNEQITQPARQAQWLAGFRQYLSYHIHAGKTYLHTRMRKQTNSMLSSLKLAVPAQLDEKVFKRARGVVGMREETKLIRNF